jgi:hypothetical protein
MGGSVLTMQSLQGVMDSQEKITTMRVSVLNQTSKSQAEQKECPSEQQREKNSIFRCMKKYRTELKRYKLTQCNGR